MCVQIEIIIILYTKAAHFVPEFKKIIIFALFYKYNYIILVEINNT